MKNAKLGVLVVVVLFSLLLAACGGGNETTTTTQATTTTGQVTTTAAAAPAIPADHAGREQCLVCHATGVGGAPIPPPAIHPADLVDSRAVCAACHPGG